MDSSKNKSYTPKDAVNKYFSNDIFKSPLKDSYVEDQRKQEKTFSTNSISGSFVNWNINKKNNNLNYIKEKKEQEIYNFIKKLVNRFDDLFEEKIIYDKNLDKTYYEYIFKYCNSWSDNEHLVIKNDIRDISLDELENEYEKQQNYYFGEKSKRYGVVIDNNFEENQLEEFAEWLNSEYYDEDTMLEMEFNLELEAPYFEEFLNRLKKEYPYEASIKNSVLFYNENDNTVFGVNKGKVAWSFLRRGSDDGIEYETKEEAFEAYLKDENYGIEDLNNKIKQDIPLWLKEILQNF